MSICQANQIIRIMQLANHHSHTTFSDGKDIPESYLEAVQQKGFFTYGFSDHAPIPIDNFGLMEMEDLKSYLSKIDSLKETCNGRMQIYKSLEVDYIPGVISVNSEHIKAANLDYSVGAVHYVETLSDGTPWGFEGSTEQFQKGLFEIFGGSVQKAVTRYFALIRQMVTEHCPDIIAHIERIRILNTGNRYFNPEDAWYQRELIDTLETIAATNAILEINTKGIFQANPADVFPSTTTLQKAIELGIPIHLSSDAHHPSEVDRHFSHATQVLMAAGCESTCIMLDGQWQETALNFKHKPVPV